MIIPKSALKILKEGGVGVIPTDTLYGVVGQALKQETVEKIYKIRDRDTKKPFIILIGQLSDLRIFGVAPTVQEKKVIQESWPGPVSIIFSCTSQKFRYLHRGKKALAFRLPKPLWLRQLVKKTGPLVVPSANPEGLPPAKTIRIARKYFGDAVQVYADSGKLISEPSALVRVRDKKIVVLRGSPPFFSTGHF